MSIWRTFARVVALGAAFATVRALADGAGEGVRLDYETDPRCAGADAFVAEVHARSPRIRFAPDASSVLVVRIESHGQKLVGRVERAGTQRTVAGATCEEVISGLALVTALALDPLATTPSSSAIPSATAPPPSTSTPPPTDAGARVEERKWTFAAGADVEVALGSAPDPMLAVPVFFEATRALGKHFGLGGALRFVHANDTALTGGAGADFEWTVGALDLCAVARAGRFQLDACERSSFGVIDAYGIGVLPARSATRPWVSFGLALAVRVRLVGPLFVEATGHVGAPLVRDRFFLEPDQTVFRAPIFAGEAGGGVGFEIW